MCIDNGKVSIIEHGNIKPPKKDKYELVERLSIVSDEIDALCQRLNPDYIIIEDFIQFMRNQTSANTIITLAIFNRMVALQVYRTTLKIPLFLLPVSVRAILRKHLRMTRKIEKEEIPTILQSYFGKSFFKLVGYKTRGKNKGRPVVEVLDEADACAVAWAGIIKLKLIEGDNA
jgi:Holliday junction resolvasome RuvABC endonuclease subunit